jgi:hypothetical protein
MTQSDVLILGAGFSRAVHDSMPLLDDLREEVLIEADLVNDGRVPSSAFEHAYTLEDWLSTLSERQPYLNEQTNLENAALFHQIRSAMVKVLLRREDEACVTAFPRWFTSLVQLVHHRRATVITLNYDRLIEVALIKSGLRDLALDDMPLIDVRSALFDVPPTRLRAVTYRDLGPYKPSWTMRLLKLHGSLDWWMGQGDATGSTLVREDLQLDQNGMPTQSTVAERTRDFTGREVFLVPPTLTKTNYFSNLVTRQLWQDAHSALSDADHVAIIGYSLPPGDSMMSGLLVSALNKPNVSVAVVNRDALDIAEKAERLGISPVTNFTGNESVADFVGSYIDRADVEFRASYLLPSPLTNEALPIVVTPGFGDHLNLLGRVVSIETVGNKEIILRSINRGNNIWGAATDDGLDKYGALPTTQDLAFVLHGARKVTVVLDRSIDTLCRPVRAVSGFALNETTPIAALISVVPDPNPR